MMTGEPHASWDQRGESIAFTLYGSSSPAVPTAYDAEDDTSTVVVTISLDYAGPCTADLVPCTSLVALEGHLDVRRPIDFIIRQQDHEDVRLVLRP